MGIFTIFCTVILVQYHKVADNFFFFSMTKSINDLDGIYLINHMLLFLNQVLELFVNIETKL